MWHPWRALRDLTHVRLVWRDLPEGRLGECDHDEQVITLTTGMLQAERRATLTHELVHLARGPVAWWLRAREERLVDAEAARLLISTEQLADGLAWALDEHELADELWVDVATVRARLCSLTGAETAEVERRLGARGDATGDVDGGLGAS